MFPFLFFEKKKKIKEICLGFDLLFLSDFNEVFYANLVCYPVICYCLGWIGWFDETYGLVVDFCTGLFLSDCPYLPNPITQSDHLNGWSTDSIFVNPTRLSRVMDYPQTRPNPPHPWPPLNICMR